MPEIQCEHCGAHVLVRGIAAVCPHCRELVTPPPPAFAALAPVDAKSDSTAVSMPVIAAPEPQIPAASSSIHVPPDIRPASSSQPAPPMPLPPTERRAHHWKVLGIAVAVVLGTVLLIDYVRLRLTRPAVVQMQAPAPAPGVEPRAQPPSQRPQTQRPSIFEAMEDPPPARREAQRPVPAPPPVVEADSPQPQPPPASTPAPTRPPRPAHPYAHLVGVRPHIAEQRTPERISDEEIGQAIHRGVDFLLGQFTQSRLKEADRYDPDTFAGLNALCVYALLHAGQAISDERLNIQSEHMRSLIARMKELPMEGNRATYSRSLRIAALAVYARPEDRSTIEKDMQWLLASSMQGAYTYSKPQPGSERKHGGWDNSNSQYGPLGIWAASEAGFRAPTSYWQDVERHWTDSQTHSGGWGYGPGAQSAYLAMTAAGVTSLFVAREQIGAQAGGTDFGGLARSIERGLEWLDEGDNSIHITAHPGYTLYSLERAGLASGYKYFGKHDWYLTLASKAIAEQRPDGSWEGGDGTLAETAFTLLFLSRGRHPIFVSKLRFDGNWSNRARDLANLTRFAGRELERPLNWQTVGLERDWVEWTDAPVLFIASDQPANFSDADIDKLRAYVAGGGLIFTHADRGSAAFNRYVEILAMKLFPDARLKPISSDHPLRSVMFPIQDDGLLGVSNGTRLLMVHSPNDLARAWTVRPLRSNLPQFEAAINVIVYAAGRREFRNRLNSIYAAAPSEPPAAVVPVARLRYGGDWDPEPGAWRRFSRVFQKQTGLAAATVPVQLADLTYETAPIAHLTGTGKAEFAEADVDALRQYVARGGVLLIDACGGSREFYHSIRKDLLPRLFPASTPEPLDELHPLISGSGEAMADLSKPRYRPYTLDTRGRHPGELAWFPAGRGAVILSELDLTSGLLGTGTWGIAGYQPASAEGFVKNVILWTLSRLTTE